MCLSYNKLICNWDFESFLGERLRLYCCGWVAKNGMTEQQTAVLLLLAVLQLRGAPRK